MTTPRYDVFATLDGRVTIGMNIDPGENPPDMSVVGPHLERHIHEGGSWRDHAASGEPREYASPGDGYDLYLDVHGPTDDAKLAGVAAKFAVAVLQYTPPTGCDD